MVKAGVEVDSELFIGVGRLDWSIEEELFDQLSSS